MKKKYLLLPVLLITLLSVSCRKDLKNVETPENYVGGTFSEVFDAFWNGMNANYVFWSIDTVNWDNMYTMYKPKFAALDINNNNDIRKSVNYFREMTANLKDSHYDISFSDPIVDSFVSPALERKLNAGIIRNRYVFYDYDATYYLDSASIVYGQDPINILDGDTTEAIAGTIGGNILYLGFNQFNLKNAYTSADNGVKRVLQYFLNTLEHATDLKGVVIDVRGNGGGDIHDLNFLVGNMITENLIVGASRNKNGNGRLDYTPWADAVITPQAGSRAITVPVVALTDIWSTSMAELTAMSIHALPNGHTVGEKTWGATGPLTNNEILNGGQFDAANFLSVYTSSAMFRYKDGKIYEGEGFPPDYAVPFNLQEFQTVGDTQLEKALSLME